MKKWMVVLGIVAAMAMGARAAELLLEGAPAKGEFYRAGEFSIDAFGLVRTSDFDNERSAAGLGANFFFTRQFGVGLETFSGDLDGVLVDDARLHLIYRIPIGKSAPYVFSGVGRNFERDDNAISLGVGIEHRFTPKWGIFADVRMDKVIDHNAVALGRTGIRISF